MATISSVGGVQYIGDAPAGETIHEHDSEINKDQIITSAVFAGPITFAATVTVTGTVVVVWQIYTTKIKKYILIEVLEN